MQCQKLGISPSTGVVKDISSRCNIYRLRIEAYYEALAKAEEAKERNENRAVMHNADRKRIKARKLCVFNVC
jgi:hypothetical protein